MANVSVWTFNGAGTPVPSEAAQTKGPSGCAVAISLSQLPADLVIRR